MAIEPIQIATNRYAPEGQQAINLYSTGVADNLTLDQLIAAICVRTAGSLEEQSVNKMNLMNAGTAMLEKTSGYIQQLADDTLTDWESAKSYLTDVVGVLGLPDSIIKYGETSYEKRMLAISAIKERLEVLTQKAQEDMIEMQTLINRRDMTFNTSSNIIRALNNTKTNAAGKLL